MITGIHHLAIICSNYEKSKQFYTEILGLTIIHETYRSERDSYKLDLGLGENYLIELFSFPNPPPRASYPESTGLRHLCFKVDKLDEMISFLGKHQINCEPIRIDEFTGKRFTFFSDPDLLPIELVEA